MTSSATQRAETPSPARERGERDPRSGEGPAQRRGSPRSGGGARVPHCNVPVLSRLLAGIELVEMDRLALLRALERFPIAVRTLDALHLATIEFLRGQGEAVERASYDNRLIAAAQALGIPFAEL
jgi:hypothetical protein